MPKKSVTGTPTPRDATHLRISGDYKGLAHRRAGRIMSYVLRLDVEHDLDRDRVKDVLRGPCRITYSVLASASNEKIVLDGTIETAMPANGDEIWLDDRGPSSVRFVISHPAMTIAADTMAQLLGMLRVTDRQLVASIEPQQPRLM